MIHYDSIKDSAYIPLYHAIGSSVVCFLSDTYEFKLSVQEILQDFPTAQRDSQGLKPVCAAGTRRQDPGYGQPQIGCHVARGRRSQRVDSCQCS